MVVAFMNAGRPFRRADIAQWLERLFCKQRVVGSNPSVGSKIAGQQYRRQNTGSDTLPAALDAMRERLIH